LLLERGANIHLCDGKNQTPTHAAAFSGHARLIEVPHTTHLAPYSPTPPPIIVAIEALIHYYIIY
jgi:hypothetical protein